EFAAGTGPEVGGMAREESKDCRDQHGCQQEAKHILPEPEITDLQQGKSEGTDYQGDEDRSHREHVASEIVTKSETYFSAPVPKSYRCCSRFSCGEALIGLPAQHIRYENHKHVQGKDQQHKSCNKSDVLP